MTRKEAEQLASFHRGYCARLIGEARGRLKPTQKVGELIRVKRVPDHSEIERILRDWVVECERRAAETRDASPDETIQDLSFLEAEIIRQMRDGRGAAPMTTRWIANELVERNDWIVSDERLRGFIEDRVARAQRELAARIKAELRWDDAPHPTHRMFAPGEFQRDRDVTAVFHPAATRDRPVLSRMSAAAGVAVVGGIAAWLTLQGKLATLVDILGRFAG